MSIVLAVIISLAVLLAGFVLFKASRRMITERLLVQRRLSMKSGSVSDARLLSMRFADLFNDQARIDSHFAKDNELAVAMWQAGFRGSNQRAIVFGIQVILPLLVAFITSIWVLFSGITQNVLMVAGMIIIGSLLIPKRFIVSRAQTRMKLLDEELSLFMQMLRILFDAGLAVEQSLRVLVEDGKTVLPVTASELETVLWRSQQGLSLEEELNKAAAALNLANFTDITVILRQMLTQGGSARASLAKLIDVMDSRRLTDMQEKVNKLSGKMTLVMVVFFFPALIILVAGPGVISIGKTLSGAG